MKSSLTSGWLVHIYIHQHSVVNEFDKNIPHTAPFYFRIMCATAPTFFIIVNWYSRRVACKSNFYNYYIYECHEYSVVVIVS